MGKTIVKKILEAASGNGDAEVGELIRIQPDLMPSSNYSVNNTIRAFKRSGMRSIIDKSKIVVINNASPFNTNHQSKDTRLMQKFILDYELENYFELGRSGIPSKVIAENGFVCPGEVIISAEHSYAELGSLGAFVIQNSPNEIALSWATGEQWVTVPESIRINLSGKIGNYITGVDIALYFLDRYTVPDIENLVLEIGGDSLMQLTLSDRLNFARTLVEFGYAAVIFEADTVVLEYLADRTSREGKYYFPDEDADYKDTYNLNLNMVQTMCAFARDGEETKILPLTAMDEPSIDKIFIGGSSSSQYEDFQLGLSLIGYETLDDHVQAFILPGSNLIYSDLINQGLAGIFLDMGYEIYPASVFWALRESAGLFTEDNTVIVTSSSLFNNAGNTPGHQVILVNNLVAFASGVAGRLIHPRAVEEMLKEKHSHHHDHN